MRPNEKLDRHDGESLECNEYYETMKQGQMHGQEQRRDQKVPMALTGFQSPADAIQKPLTGFGTPMDSLNAETNNLI
jgi:hypothetical protein